MPRRTSRLSRHAALPTRGRGKRFRGYVRDEPFRLFVRQRGCLIAGQHECWGLIDFCHVKSRGAGGQDTANGWPGCRRAHDEQHTIGRRSFERRYGVDLARVARELHAAYESQF